MQTKTALAHNFAKLSRLWIQGFHLGRGETAPGLVALRLDPNFIGNTNQHIPHRIVVSGTNGKTTTTQMMATVLKHAKKAFITNPTGSNLLRGIATASLDITSKTHYTLWEADEAALIAINQQVHPTDVVFTNLFRDQLDRYGEIDTTLNRWLTSLTKIPPARLLLNGDDPSLAYLGNQLAKRHHCTFFGLDTTQTSKKLDASADAIFCPYCHRELQYKTIFFSHLGDYSCKCGFKRPSLNYKATAIELTSDQLKFKVKKAVIHIPLDGLYNVYNTLAAYSLLNSLHLSDSTIQTAMNQFKPVFGRQETIVHSGKELQLWLVKNPTGFNQVLHTILRRNIQMPLCIAINDNFADGTDISWLWDVDFELLKSFNLPMVITGTRAWDMAVRLKYAGLTSKQYQVVPDIKKAMSTIQTHSNPRWFILPTYTALWKIKEILT